VKGILGKKLGMTQVFDPESGGVTPVTVIEAGPCPVVLVRTPEKDGYEAVQLAWEPVASRKISKGEQGHLARGKGFAGTIKRHNFRRGPKSHGSHNIRKPGSIGASATPSRVFKGMRMAGQMGARRATPVGLSVHSVDAERNLLLVKGAVPGPKNGLVEIREDSSHHG
jgi:large subunit ribosomal protein L3